jgi:hypothetical protein
MPHHLPKRSGGCAGRFRVSGHKRGADLAVATHHSAGCGPPSCVRHLMFKFWELSVIIVVELVFVPGSHSFGLGEATPEGENAWNNRWN